MTTEQRHVLACLRIWTAAGVSITRQGQRIRLEGIDPPGWWRNWCEKNARTLAELLPDEQAPERPHKRRPLPEDQRIAWNTLGAPRTRERPRRLLPGTVRLELLERLRQFAEL